MRRSLSIHTASGRYHKPNRRAGLGRVINHRGNSRSRFIVIAENDRLKRRLLAIVSFGEQKRSLLYMYK